MRDATDASGTENLEVMEEAVRYNAWLLDMVRRHVKGGCVLDFGAGRGTFARHLQRPGELRVVCVEPDARARADLKRAGLEVYARTEDVAEESMDAAYTLNVLEHIPDDVAALRDLRRCLKPGARLFVYVPAFRVLFSSMDVRVGHLRRYRRRDLCLRLRSAGFAVERARYADCLGFFAALLYRLCGNREGQLNRDALRMYDRLAFPLSRGLDQVVGHVLGKNIWVSAYRPAGIVGTLIECPSTLGRTHSCPFL